jgi:release factor glutamine methyltransferase
VERLTPDSNRGGSTHEPMMSAERAQRIREWQDAIFAAQKDAADVTMSYLGLELTVPRQVHAPAPMSELLGRAVLAEVRGSDRVLDMGAGSGVNAILAASRSSEVVAVDVNPFAIETARQNAQRNGVSARVEVVESDVFRNVEGTFHLIVFDPPFR